MEDQEEKLEALKKKHNERSDEKLERDIALEKMLDVLCSQQERLRRRKLLRIRVDEKLRPSITRHIWNKYWSR